MHNCDIIIVGGGAAGLFAAITAKRENKNLRITIIERNDRVGKKLITTGNGRCNLSNKDLAITHFHSSDNSFLNKALEGNSLNNTAEFYHSIGVETVAEEDGRIFPYSLQASSVVDALRFSLEESNIELVTDTKIDSIKYLKNGFICSSEKNEFFGRAVILATGGLAGGVRLGCDKTGYFIAESFGHKIIKTLPAITQVKTDTSVIRRFKGIKTDAVVTAFSENKAIRSEYGELLFTDYGVSGPAVFQISGSLSGQKNCEISVDLMPDFSYDRLTDALTERRRAIAKREASEFLTGFINKRIGQYFTKVYCENTAYSKDITDKQIRALAKAVKNFKLRVTGVADFGNAQVTKGGIDCRDINPHTLMSKKQKGLFFAGEAMDVDGDCGGYNLQWALHSASVAARSAVELLK